MAVSISSLTSFFKDEQKSINRGENHYKSGHVEQCRLDAGVLTGVVRASMKDKVYNVSVSESQDNECSDSQRGVPIKCIDCP